MAWNGSGTFSRTNGTYTGTTVWQQDEAALVDIEADRHDTHDQDLAAGINACLAKNGENAMTGNLNMGSNDITNAGDASFSGDVTIGGTLSVTGSVTMPDDLAVTGNQTVGGTLGVTGAATLSSTLGVTGAATLSSTLAVTGASTFTGAAGFNGGVTLTSTDAGSTENPTLALCRNSASPAASDELGVIDFQGEDSGGGTQTYAKVLGVISDPTAGSEDGRLSIQTAVAGTVAERVSIGQGITVGGATGGDQGAGTINATGLYVNGTSVGDNAVRAWVNFNVTSTVPAIREDFNVSSITDGGVGNFTINFTNAIADANYAAVANYSDTNTADGAFNDGQASCWSHATGSVRVFVADGSGDAQDPIFCSVIVVR